MTAHVITRTGGPGGSRAGAFLGKLLEVLAGASHAARCAREAERLFARSDEELARMGLRRDEVVRHAFAPYLHI